MLMPRAAAPLAAALLGLAGSLAATLALHHAASAALDRVLEERLRGAGATAALLLGASAPPPRSSARSWTPTGSRAPTSSPRGWWCSPTRPAPPAGARTSSGWITLASRAALAGEPSVAFGVRRGRPAGGDRLLPGARRGRRRARGAGPRGGAALRVGRARPAPARAPGGRRGPRRAGGAGARAGGARRSARAEDGQRRTRARAARGDALARMAAVVAHEIRNPLGIIRAAVELLRERAGAALGPRDREGLEDVLGEVARLRRLTQDFLELSAEPALQPEPVDLAGLAAEAARGSAALHPELAVTVAVGEGLPPVKADPARLRQVLSNLLENAALAGAHARGDPAATRGRRGPARGARRRSGRGRRGPRPPLRCRS